MAHPDVGVVVGVGASSAMAHSILLLPGEGEGCCCGCDGLSIEEEGVVAMGVVGVVSPT